MSKQKPRMFFKRPDGGLHERIWFAKAGKGPQEAGIAPMAARHLANGTYSVSMTDFNPIGLSLEEAVEAGKAGSLYKNAGAQFGAQVWRLAHEAKVGDFIFLESENHHLEAVGYISGTYSQSDKAQLNHDDLIEQGIHRIPVHWIPIKNGRDAIQLGRLDNAIFRNIIEKTELVDLLLMLTRQINCEAWGLPYNPEAAASSDETLVEPLKAAGPIKPFKSQASVAARAPEPAPAPFVQPKPVVVPPPPPAPTRYKIARQGQIILDLTESELRAQLSTGSIFSSDHYWTAGMSGWESMANFPAK